MIRILNLGPAKHEKVAIYVVNQQISNVCRIAGAALQRSNPCIIRVQLFTGMNADIPDKKNRTGKEEPG